MRLPCEKWLEALITVEPPYSNEELQAIVSFRGYPKPEVLYLKFLRDRQAKTKPFPYDPHALHCIRWLKELRVYDYVRRRSAVTQALSLLGLEEVRLKVELLLLGRVLPADLTLIVQEACGMQFTGEVFGYFRHFFWNPDAMSAVDWAALFPHYRNGDLLQSVYEANDQNAALAKAGLGLNMDITEVLDMLAADAYARFKALGHSAVDENIRKAAQVWSAILFRASELKIRSGDVSVKLLEMMESFALAQDHTARRTIHDLRQVGDLIALPGMTHGKKES